MANAIEYWGSDDRGAVPTHSAPVVDFGFTTDPDGLPISVAEELDEYDGKEALGVYHPVGGVNPDGSINERPSIEIAARVGEWYTPDHISLAGRMRACVVAHELGHSLSMALNRPHLEGEASLMYATLTMIWRDDELICPWSLADQVEWDETH